jgi:glycosyltransferase involved in cell wall biosynthesis
VNPLKVLMIAPGNTIHAIRALQQLLDHRFEVILAGQVNPYPQSQPDYKYIWYPYLGRCIYRRLGHPMGDWVGLFTFVPLLRYINRRFKPDLTHVHWIDCHAYYCVRAGLKPLILSAWGSDINNCLLPGAEPIHSQLVGKALLEADKVIVPNTNLAERCNILAGKPVNTETVFWGVDPDLFYPGYQTEAKRWKEKLEIPEKGQVILSIRALTPIYRHEIILKAFSEAKIKLEKPAYLVFTSYNQQNSEYGISLKHSIKELGMSDYVRWIESIPHREMPILYSLADSVISFPIMDGFPVTFIEAAACDCPVITCSLPGYENTFVSRYFHVVPSNRMEDLALAIIAELNQKKTIRSKFSLVRQEIIEKYSQDTYVNKLLAIYGSFVRK